MTTKQNEAHPARSIAEEVARWLPAGTRLLGFGEPLHGEERFLRHRNELFAHLVEHAGFGAIAVESDCLRGRVVNAHVRTGEGVLDDVLRTGFSHGFGTAPADRDLVRWLAEHNRTAAEPVRFHGFDAPVEMMGAESPRGALAIVHGYLTARVGHVLPWERIDALLGDDARWSDPAAAMDHTRSVGDTPEARELRLIADDLRWLLTAESPGLADDPDARWDAELAARTATGLLAYHAGMAGDSPRRVSRLLGVRDAMMAENLCALAERDTRPTLVFAHNQHLRAGAVRWDLAGMDLRWHSAGAHVARRLGPAYAVIATAVGRAERHGIAEPEPGSVEGLLLAAGGGTRLVPSAGLPTATTRRTPGNPGYFPLDPAHTDEVDAVWFVPEL
ncbi:erythromycin esterase family protein [Saccharothrix obliqua]|uniref:erythromycin esterase family protein n=1 Tax=Saccharothrix obliqua TaxID=2861747 RepID=UPI001C5FA094|nr:erythromycin esterase family protein [Saccharothrix obliqua]MBW4718522.1 erythromycin esterase family protein [Saccharothrix obliqua]